jgi:hopanoid biosynthesis associated protein HpnK
VIPTLPSRPVRLDLSHTQVPSKREDGKCVVGMQIILNADDFGCSSSVNTAIIQAHRQGVLTSASLMVAGEALEEAVTLARQTPTLAVGLHVVVAGGRAVLPPEQLPHLVDGSSRFPDSPLHAGLRYTFSHSAKEELARELEAQFERFAETGLPLSHVDGHLHMHVHPTVFDLLLPLAARYGAQGLRLPRDGFLLAMGHDRRQAGTKALWALAFGLLGRRCLLHLNGQQLTVAHRVYGLMQTGQMQEAYVIDLLRRFRGPTAEIYFHPSTLRQKEELGPNPDDLATLLSPAVRRTLEEKGLRPATYSTLSRE